MYRYYSALKATDGYQTLLRPLYLHNDNAGVITLDIKPFPENSVIAPFAATTTNVLPGLTKFKPELKSAQAATAYPVRNETGSGSGAEITTTVTETQDGTIANLNLMTYDTGSPGATAVTEYRPTTDGNGTGFIVRFSTSVGAMNPTNIQIVNAGSGYEVGDTLIYTILGTTVTATTVTGNYGTGFFITAAVSTTVGEDYSNGDVVAITLTETVLGVTYTYEALFTVSNDMLVSAGAVPLKLNAGETSVVPALEFRVQGTEDKSVLALLAVEI